MTYQINNPISSPSTYPLFGFNGQSGQDQTAQQGLQQYIQQGQLSIDPGQAQIAASNPIAAAGHSNLGQAFQAAQQQRLPAQQPSAGPGAPIGNLPVAPGIYQSQAALDNAQGPLYPSRYAAQQAQPWLSRMADALMGGDS